MKVRLWGVVKVSLTVSLLWHAGCSHPAPSPPAPGAQPGPAEDRWKIVQDHDDAHPESLALMVNQSWIIRKTLVLEVEPARVAEAAVDFKMNRDPYDEAKKKHTSDPSDAPDVNLQVALNGQLLAEENIGSIASKGWHRVPVQVDLLKKGANEVLISPSAGGAYVYVAVDPDSDHDRSCASIDRGETWDCERVNPSAVWALSVGKELPGGAISKAGEYKVRLLYRRK